MSLIVVASVVPGAALIGTAIGMVSAWLGGVWGQILMRLVDVQLALPAILFAVLLASLLGPQPAQRDHHPADLDLAQPRRGWCGPRCSH